jgi:hypothetical protein
MNRWTPELKVWSRARVADRSGISGRASVAVPLGTATLLSWTSRPIGRSSSASRASTRVAEIA